MNQTVLVKKRFGPETLDVREFIRPDSYMVKQLADQIGRRTRNTFAFVEQAWRYSLHDVKMPTGDLLTRDWHSLSAFRNSGSNEGVIRYQANDFWAFPSETIACKMGDCDDKSILLTSLLRRRLPSNKVYATVGTYRGVGHMWVTVFDRQGPVVLETTVNQPRTREDGPYSPMFRFNDMYVSVKGQLRDLPLALGG